VVVCLVRGADLHTALLMPLTVSCSSKIQIGFTFLVPAHLGNPGPRAVKLVCVVCVCACTYSLDLDKWINAAPSDSSDEELSSSSIFAPTSDRSIAG